MTDIAVKYKKNEFDELFLEKFNLTLSDLEKDCVAALEPSGLPILFICGAPRSGTTLLTQVLAKTGLFNYITNFVARFWRAPFAGLCVEKLTGVRGLNMQHTFGSRLGRTTGILDPHEFTYFWKHWLKPEGPTDVIPETKLSEIDTAGINREVNAMLAFYDKPMFFKTYLVMINPLILQKIFKNSYFIIFKRDLLSNALSIFNARKEYFDDKEKWWSIKPSNYDELKGLAVEEQIVGQINGIYSDIESQVKNFRDRTMGLTYEELCANPAENVNKIRRFLKMQDTEAPEIRKKIPDSFAVGGAKTSSAVLDRFKKAVAGA